MQIFVIYFSHICFLYYTLSFNTVDKSFMALNVLNDIISNKGRYTTFVLVPKLVLVSPKLRTIHALCKNRMF